MKITEQTEVKKWLERADRQFASGDDRNGSLSMWQATKTAIAPLAAKRGWPCETDEDITAAVRRFDAEYDDRNTVMLYFGPVGAFHHNATIGFYGGLRHQTLSPLGCPVSGRLAAASCRRMTPRDHISELDDWLRTAHEKRSQGKRMQESESLWCAVKHAVDAVAMLNKPGSTA